MSEAIVDALIAARKARRPIDPANHPVASLGEALRVQTRVQERLGGAVGGWKTGLAPDRSGICAPLPAPLPDATQAPRVAIGEAVIKIEIELAARLRRDLTAAGEAVTREQVVEAIDQILFGVEIVEARFPDSRSFEQFVADHMANLTYIVGPRAPDDALGRIGEMRGRIAHDGRTISDAPCVHPTGDPLASLLACANSPTARPGGFRAGQIVTLGALTGAVPATGPGAYEATLSGVGTVRFALVPVQ